MFPAIICLLSPLLAVVSGLRNQYVSEPFLFYGEEGVEPVPLSLLELPE
jgi:hypothetical protein